MPDFRLIPALQDAGFFRFVPWARCQPDVNVGLDPPTAGGSSRSSTWLDGPLISVCEGVWLESETRRQSQDESVEFGTAAGRERYSSRGPSAEAAAT